MTDPLKIRRNITFGKLGSILALKPYGFDLSEPAISWTQEEVAGFSVDLDAVPADVSLRLNVTAMPFIHAGRVDRQQLFVFVNGLYVGFRTLVAHDQIMFLLPDHLPSTVGLRIEFVIPTASSPKSLGISNDIRKLGIAISQASFSHQE